MDTLNNTSRRWEICYDVAQSFLAATPIPVTVKGQLKSKYGKIVTPPRKCITFLGISLQHSFAVIFW